MTTKRKAFFLVMLCALLVIPMIGQAAGTDPSLNLENSEDTPSFDFFDENVQMNMQSSSNQYIKSAGAIIARHGNQVDSTGWTETYSRVSTIGIYLYVQRWQNGQWRDVAYLGHRSQSNSAQVFLSNVHTPVKGYYYRVRGIHYATSGSTETVHTASTAIWFD